MIWFLIDLAIANDCQKEILDKGCFDLCIMSENPPYDTGYEHLGVCWCADKKPIERSKEKRVGPKIPRKKSRPTPGFIPWKPLDD